MRYLLQEKEQLEISYWKNSPTESPAADSIDNLANKFSESRVLLQKLQYHKSCFERAHSILEIGAGQGWAACIIKRRFPQKRVAACDISPYAVASGVKWERILQVSLDGAFGAKSYELPLAHQSFDLIFCFQAAHHFVAHRRTLQEIRRVLRPGGSCLYLHEPSCRQWVHRLAHTRVNDPRRAAVPEDVLVFKRIASLAGESGLEVVLRFDPTVVNREPIEGLYYLVLQRSPFLQHLLPCSMDYVFTRPP